MSNGPVLVGPCHVYIPKAFRWKGYPSFLCHIVEAMFMQMLGLACRKGGRSLEFTLSWNLRCFRKLRYHLETMCACVASVSPWLVNLLTALLTAG